MLLSTVMWSTDGWDAPATVAGSVANPEKTYPRAVFMCLAFCVVSTALPVMVGISYYPDRKQWETKHGFWAQVGVIIIECQSS